MAWTLQGNLNPLSVATATTNQMAAWSGDPTMFASNHSPTAGSIYFIRCYVDNPVSSSHMYTHVLTGGSGLSNCFLGVYQAGVGGSRLGLTADISSSLTTSSVDVTVALTGAVTGLTRNQEIYLAILIGSGSTTSPSMLAVRQFGTNLGMSSDYRYQKSTTTTNTTLPSTVPALSQPAAGFEFLALGP